MKRIYFIAILAFIFLSKNAFPIDFSKNFIKANEAYEKKNYEAAIEIYKTILEDEKNASLYYNLGNSYFKAGKIGLALANYLRAKRYAPSNSDLNDNINYLRALRKNIIEDNSRFNIVYKTFFFYDFFSIRDFFYIFIILNTAFFFLLIIMLFLKRDLLNWSKKLILLLLILSVVGIALNYKKHYYDKNGIVICNEASVRSGNSLNDTAIFNLYEGTEFKVIGEKDDWLKIQLLDNKRGWVSKEVAELI